MKGYIQTYRGKRKSTYYVIIRWSGKKWVIKNDRQGDRFESHAHAGRHLEYLRALIDDNRFDPADWVEDKPHGFEKVAESYFQYYMDEIKRGHISPSTLAVKKRHFGKYFILYFAGYDVKRIIALDLHNFYQQLPLLKPKSVLDIICELNVFLTWCRDQGVIKEVPRFRDMKKLRRQARESRPLVREETHYMGREDYERVLRCMRDTDRPIFEFIRETGCRPSEARAIQRRDVKGSSGLLEIKRTMASSSDGDIIVERPKSGSRRVVAISEKLKGILRRATPGIGTAFVFYNPKTGTAYTRGELRYRWKRAIRLAGVPYMSLYRATRSSFACAKLKEGFSYARVGAAMGHRNESTTRRYGEIFIDREIWG